MSIPQTRAGDVIRVEPLQCEAHAPRVVALLRSDMFEVFHLTVPARWTVPTHEFQGEAIVHCLQGRVSLLGPGRVYALDAGELLHYSANEPLSVLGIENSSLLIVLAISKSGVKPELIG